MDLSAVRRGEMRALRQRSGTRTSKIYKTVDLTYVSEAFGIIVS